MSEPNCPHYPAIPHIMVAGVKIPVLIGGDEIEHLRDAHACYMYDDYAIYLHENTLRRTPEFIQMILTHETMHAVLHLAGIVMPPAKEEQLVEVLTHLGVPAVKSIPLPECN